MSVKPGYKQTEAGVIPEDWRESTLGEVAEVRSGATPSTLIPAFWNGTIPWCTPTDITATARKYLHATERNITQAGLNSCPAVLLPVGTLLLCSRATIGEVKIAVTAICTNQGFKSLVCSKEVYNEFIYYLLLTLKPQMLERAIGSTFLEIGKRDIASISIPLPQRSEQQAIAEALSDADALIESLEQLIAKKRQIKQGAIQQLLTGRKRLPGFAERWKLKNIGQLLVVQHGKSQKDVETESSPYPILGTSGVLGYATRPLYDKPSVLIGRKGTIDRPQYMDKPFWSVDTLFYTHILDDNDAKYLFYRFWLINWKQYNEASGVPSLNAKTIESIEIMTPPAHEQTAIAEILSDMDAEITELETRLAKVHQIKQGMMQQLLTGRIRLVKPQSRPIAEADIAAM